MSGNFGRSFGIHYLLLDPEYLGHVDLVSFSILGAALGGFIITWNITTYILESYRFPFLATFERPFAIYCLNNTILPLAFVITYTTVLIHFQLKNEFTTGKNIALDLAGLFGGMFSVIFLSAIYFQTTNKNIFNLFAKELAPTSIISEKVKQQEEKKWLSMQLAQAEFRVDVFLTYQFHIRPTRSVKHYDEKMLKEVFRQNHFNAFIIELVTMLLILALGFMIDHPVFRIPAGASALLFFSMLVAASGMLDFWLKGWKFLFLIVLIMAINMAMIKFGAFSYTNKAYGVRYDTQPAEYSYSNLNSIASPENIRKDQLNTISMLNAWKAHTGEKKPVMILMNFSGGGLSAGMFSAAVIQKADSVLKGGLMKHTVMMTGASGGMIGAAYMREIYLKEMKKTVHSLEGSDYLDNVSKDLLNSLIFTSVTNDMFYPWQTFKVGNNVYHKDRGYIFEKQLNENMNNTLRHSISAYDQYEKAGVIPMMVLTPTIINDQRRLLIAAQPLSYLMRPTEHNYTNDTTDIDGVDFQALFAKQDAGNLQMTTAIRMSATYPYILPFVALPSQPAIKVMDAGVRDNYGISTSLRFVKVFREWIKQNTSGVVVVQVRQYRREREIEDYQTETVLSNLLTPITNVYNNLTTVQDYDQTIEMSEVFANLEGKMAFVNFEFKPAKKEMETSLSFHLTTKEKADIVSTVNQPNIANGIDRLKFYLEKKHYSTSYIRSEPRMEGDTLLPGQTDSTINSPQPSEGTMDSAMGKKLGVKQ